MRAIRWFPRINERTEPHGHDDSLHPTTQLAATQPCRFCGAGCGGRLSISGCLRFARPIRRPSDLNRGEVYYPLHVYVCEQCFLVQLEEYESAEKYFQRLRLFLFLFRFLAQALLRNTATK